ncbi:MAG TPA: hypothetical protein VL178_04415 [Pseudomonas sp.]|nr:hypothetical protein [Pseudomonas sp.]
MEDRAGMPITQDDVTFTVSEFMEFLAATGRSSKCPVCPHQGDWIFHTMPDNETVAIYAAKHFGMDDGYMPVAYMECPTCGFLQQTSLFAVMYHRKGVRNES